MSRFLVTGASGFVGQALCRELLSRGHDVVGVTRREFHVDDHARFRNLIVDSIEADSDWSGIPDGVGCVIHLAARVHVMRDTSADPLKEFWKINVDGTRCLAKAAIERGITRFVYVSSIKVNGETTNGLNAFTETDEPVPTDDYGQSKLAAETSLQGLYEEFGGELVIVRPPLVYGAKVGGNFARLIRLIQSGVPLPFGAIRNRRSLVSIENLVDFLILCASHPAAADNTFLVSDGDDLSTPELVAQIAGALGMRSRLLPVPVSMLRLAGRCLGKTNEVQRLTDSLQADIEKSRRLLHWQPPFSVQDSVRRAVT